jgi:hypothetical protein
VEAYRESPISKYKIYGMHTDREDASSLNSLGYLEKTLSMSGTNALFNLSSLAVNENQLNFRRKLCW